MPQLSSYLMTKHFVDIKWLWQRDDSKCPRCRSNLDPDQVPGAQYDTRGHIKQSWFESALLWKYARLSSGHMVEIGRYKGGSSVLMLEATYHTPERKLTSIDMRKRESSCCLEYLEKNSHRYTMYFGRSEEAVIDHDYGLLFIDGGHTYEGVKMDTERFWPKLAVGGYAIWHDFLCPNQPGVNKWLNEWLDTGKPEKLEVSGTSLAVKKIS